MKTQIVNAIICLFPEGLGGKSRPIVSGYHPNLVWGFNGEISSLLDEGKLILKDAHEYQAKSIDGIIYLKNGATPGNIFECKIQMSYENWFTNYVYDQQTFLVREGYNVYGVGIVLKESIKQ